MTVTAVEAPKKRKVPEHILDAIVDTSNGFWLTSTINGEKYMERPANDLEIATWRQRDRERKEAAEEEKSRLAEIAYDKQNCGYCGIIRIAHTSIDHPFSEEPWVEPELIETVPLGSDAPVIEGTVEAWPSDGAVYDSSAEGDEPSAK